MARCTIDKDKDVVKQDFTHTLQYRIGLQQLLFHLVHLLALPTHCSHI